ncbi:hypothetical protein EST38_g6622 [Candolleomyces aberdarensis]|uniref:Uncharacterized protein n=1 Tax=Candolleomyces aberdarensis TaxID=2316362 RepID=A0A4Q2DH75_9AGAR|nr:hypothetical protein EST38_g6622 [Candolleomyces aberdarensis]
MPSPFLLFLKRTATLVQGPAGATFTYTAPTEAPIPPGFTIDVKCSFTGANAVCTQEVPNGVSSGTIAIEEGLIPVALGTTLPGVQLTTTGGNTPTTSAEPSRRTTSPAGTGQTSAGASNPSPTSGAVVLKSSTASLSALLLMTFAATFVL